MKKNKIYYRYKFISKHIDMNNLFPMYFKYKFLDLLTNKIHFLKKPKNQNFYKFNGNIFFSLEDFDYFLGEQLLIKKK